MTTNKKSKLPKQTKEEKLEKRRKYMSTYRSNNRLAYNEYQKNYRQKKKVEYDNNMKLLEKIRTSGLIDSNALETLKDKWIKD